MGNKTIFCNARNKAQDIHMQDCIPNPLHPSCRECQSPNKEKQEFDKPPAEPDNDEYTEEESTHEVEFEADTAHIAIDSIDDISLLEAGDDLDNL